MDSIIYFLEQYPALICLAIALSAFTETIVGLGMFVPSFILMITLTTTAAIVGVPFIWVIISAMSGAYAGDCFGYALGRYFSSSIQTSRLFARREKWFNKVQHRYENHGLFFIVIARFIAPLRCLIPFISGSLQIHPRLFFPLAFFAVLAWAPFYTLPGYVAGQTDQWLTKDEINAYILNINVLYLILTVFCIWLIFAIAFMLVNKMEKWFREESATPDYRPVIFSLVTICIIWALNSQNSQISNLHMTNWFTQLPFSQTDLNMQTKALWLLLVVSSIWLSLLRAYVGVIILIATMVGLLINEWIEPVESLQIFALNIWLLVLITSSTMFNNRAFRRSMMAVGCITLFLLGVIAVMDNKMSFFYMMILLLISLWVNHLHRFVKLKIQMLGGAKKLPKTAHLIILVWLAVGLISGYL